MAKAGDWTWEDYFGILEQITGMDLDGTSMYGTTVIGAQPLPVVHMYSQLSASYGTRWFTQFPEAPCDFTPTINSDANLAALDGIYPFLETQLEMMKLGDGKAVRPPAPIYTSQEGVYGLQINQAMSGQVSSEQALATR